MHPKNKCLSPDLDLRAETRTAAPGSCLERAEIRRRPAQPAPRKAERRFRPNLLPLEPATKPPDPSLPGTGGRHDPQPAQLPTAKVRTPRGTPKAGCPSRRG